MPFSTDLSTSPLPDSRITFRRHHANEPSKTTPLGRTSPDQAKEQMDAARRRARQSIREYELIWLLQQRMRAVSWPHWRLRCMQRV